VVDVGKWKCDAASTSNGSSPLLHWPPNTNTAGVTKILFEMAGGRTARQVSLDVDVFGDT
jgi:hypothetical protein